ncbi:TB2/DP1, HVA22 family-domain-containing protein [Globomyces pollinis-pini]|nr:TB2/DP1, HVA22 family-domain-containing protein [Globomyces pollinis-pini]
MDNLEQSKIIEVIQTVNTTPSIPGSFHDPSDNHYNNHSNNEDGKYTRKYWDLIQKLKVKLPYFEVFFQYLETSVPLIHEREVYITQLTLFKYINQYFRINPLVSAFIGTLVSFIAMFQLSRTKPLFLSQLLGIVYPIYASLTAVERPKPHDDERWLTYWSCFGLFVLLDHKYQSIKQTTGVYFVPKAIILYWLSQNGSLHVYRRLIRPLLLKFQLLD